MTEFSTAKTGEYPGIKFPSFRNSMCCDNDLKNNKHSSLHLARKYARIFVLGRRRYVSDNAEWLRHTELCDSYQALPIVIV